MDFRFTEDQEMLKNAFREFIEAEVAPNAAKWDEEDHFPVEIWPKLGEIGILGIFIPEEYGGTGLGHIERVMVIEEIARYSAGLAIAIFTHHLCMGAILDGATEEQKRKYLPSLCDGSQVCGLAVTEPGGGSDYAGQKTTAVKAGDDWIVNGRKCFITNGGPADITVCTVVTGQDERGRNQLTAFLFEKDDKGFGPGRKEHKMGLRGSWTGDVIMDEVKISADRMIGAEGAGAGLGMKQIGEIGRASMAAIGVGIMRGCIEEGVKFSNDRIIYGKPLSKIQAVQFHIAEIRTWYEAARLLTYRAAAMKDRGESAITEFAMAKYFSVDMAVKASQNAIELMGAYGIMDEYPVARFHRDALASISSGGTTEIQKLIVAGATLRGWKA